MNIDDLTIRELKEIQAIGNPQCERSFIKPGSNVFIRTVTHHYTGHVEAISGTEIKLSKAAWIADDGRFSEAVATGVFNEVEPYPENYHPVLNRSTFLDIVEVPWKLPGEIK